MRVFVYNPVDVEEILRQPDSKAWRYHFHTFGDVEPLYLIPVGGDLKTNIRLLMDYQQQVAGDPDPFGADNELKQEIDRLFPGVFEWRPSEPDFDYIYNTEDLALLKGRKYYSKRNHILSFSSKYDWSYEVIGQTTRTRPTRWS